MILALKTDLMRHSMKITKIQYASNYIHFLTEAVTGQTLFRHLVEFDHPGMSSRDPSSGSTASKHHPQKNSFMPYLWATKPLVGIGYIIISIKSSEI